MKALPTQFDDKRLSNAVATPTCSSCCCCCCCLATSIASSTLLAQRIGKEGEKHQVFNRHMLTVLAALFMPLTIALVYAGTWTINSLVKTCTERTYGFSSAGGGETYNICTNPGSAVIWPLIILAPFLVLWYLYSRVKIEKPLQRAVLVTTLIAVAFAVEFFAGATLILTGAGGIVYLIMIPIIVGWITVWYHRHLGRESNEEARIVSIQPIDPTVSRTMEEYERNTAPAQSSDQNTPPSSSQ